MEEMAASPGRPTQPAFSSKNSAAREAEFLWKQRKYVLLLATFSATATYSAGLSTPGGFWPDNDGVRLAGDPVLQMTYAHRYKVFFYSNATAFVASVVIVNLLLIRSLCRRRWWLRSLQAAMILDQFGLMGAYAAGSCREVAMSVYVFVLVILVFSYVLVHLLFFALTLEVHGGKETTPRPSNKQAICPEGHSEPTGDGRRGEGDEFLERVRNYLLIFATLAATVTYQAGLSTPGGFWPDSQGNDHLAGDLLLRSRHPYRFMVFFYSNTSAFVASMVIILLLMSKTVTRHGIRSYALWVCVSATLLGMMGAFAAGSCRRVATSLYVIALVAAVLFFIAIQVLVFVSKSVQDWLQYVQQVLERLLKLQKLESQNGHELPDMESKHCKRDDQLLKKTRMHLLLLGILAASVTYQVGLNPPGSFWQRGAEDGHYLAGDPILQVTYPRRYNVFFYSNATAFVASLVILILLLSNIFGRQGIKYCALQTAMIMDLFGLIGAYAAGSCREVSASIYISVVVVPVFLYVGIHVLVFMTELFSICAVWRGMCWQKLEQYTPCWLKRKFEMGNNERVEGDEAVERKLEKRRKLLLLLAILAATLTYQAGMNPPGGFWSENKSHHVEGNPVLNDNYRRRYLAFFYCNATAFVASLAIIMLLVNRKLSASGIRTNALRVCVTLNLFGLMGAFASGSCRKVSTSIYVLALNFAVLACIVFQVVLFVSESFRALTQKLLSKCCVPEEEAGDMLPVTSGNGEARDQWDEKLPKYLLLLGALAAAVTYQVGFSPPGGLFSDGDPILRSTYPRRYMVFFYCNATSFIASLVVMVLLLIKRVSNARPTLRALHAAMILVLLGLMGAYAAGSCRKVSTSAYIMALVVGVSVYIVVLVVVSVGVARWLKRVGGEVVERVTFCFSIEDL